MNATEAAQFARLQSDNKLLRDENTRLKAAGNADKLAKFQKEADAARDRAVNFAIKTIETKTMEMVAQHIAPTFNLPPQAMIFRAFRDCLRLSTHFVDPARMVALYNALQHQNPNPDGSVPSYEQLQALVPPSSLPPAPPQEFDPTTLNTTRLPQREQALFNALARVWHRSKNKPYPTEELTNDLLPVLKSTEELRKSNPEHPAPALVDELCEAIDNNAADIGGSRPEQTILREALVSFFPSRPDTETELTENLDALKGTDDAPQA